MEVTEHRMVEFVTAYLEVPFGAIESVAAKVVEASESFNSRNGPVHPWKEGDGLTSREKLPLPLKAGFVEKHNRQIP